MSLDAALAEVRAHPLVGWDFSWIGERVATSELPWDYDAVVEAYARDSADLLDMDTGGGERLSRLANRPPRTVATESWAPNVAVAAKRLHTLGVTVVATRPDELPFAESSFSLVTNRHASFDAGEVARVLAPGGVFVTQQVSDENGAFHRALGLPEPDAGTWDLAAAVAEVEAVGLQVEQSAEAEQTYTFADAAALAWFLENVPWTVPGFSSETHRAQLEDVHMRIERDGPLAIERGAFWLAARKPA